MKRKYLNIIFWFFLITLGLFTTLSLAQGFAAFFGYAGWEKGAIGAIGSLIGIGSIRSNYLKILQNEFLPD